MSNKTAGFNLINSKFRQMSSAHPFYINYHLMSFDLYAKSTLHHVSKHDFILKTNQFIDVRCRKWGDYFFKIFYRNLHYYKRFVPKLYFSVLVSGNDCKYCNVIESLKTVFQRFQDYFAILSKVCFLYYFRAALKRLAFNLSAMC